MPFVFRRRLSLTSGLGINVSLRGLTLSFRGPLGSFGTSGFSIRTPVPGLRFQTTFGRNSQSRSLVSAISLLVALIPAFTRFVALIALIGYWLLVVVPFNVAKYVTLTMMDFVVYLFGVRE